MVLVLQAHLHVCGQRLVLDSSKAVDVLEGFTRALCALPEELRQTLTYDQGKEMALHKRLADNTGLAIYFCDHHRCSSTMPACKKPALSLLLHLVFESAVL